MALLVGQCLVDPVTGMAGRMFAAAAAAGPASGLSPDAFTEGTAARASLAAFLTAIATGVVEEVQTNGKAVVKTSDRALQQYGAGIETEGPYEKKTLSIE